MLKKSILLSLATLSLLANDTKGYYPSDKEINYKNVISANKNNWCKLLKDAPQKTLLELEDGTYVDHCAIKNKSYITIKAKNKYGVLYNGDEYFVELLDKNHHIQLLGIEVAPLSDKHDSGLLKAHGYGSYDNHHVYIADSWIHHSGSAILTAPRSHDITLDHCLIHDIKLGYYWYALGWHLSMTNCVAYHPENNGVALRGHYPTNRLWSYKKSQTVDITKEKNIENLPKDEWTHFVANNFFGKGYGRVAKRNWERGSAIAFYQGRGNDDGDDAYLPPQNVIIENNTFYDITPSKAPNGEVFAGAITIDAEAGFADANKSDVAGIIKGTIIRDNTSDGKLLKSFWQKPDMKLITLKNNKIKSSKLLKEEFIKKVDELKKPRY